MSTQIIIKPIIIKLFPKNIDFYHLLRYNRIINKKKTGNKYGIHRLADARWEILSLQT